MQPVSPDYQVDPADVQKVGIIDGQAQTIHNSDKVVALLFPKGVAHRIEYTPERGVITVTFLREKVGDDPSDLPTVTIYLPTGMSLTVETA